MPLHSVQVPCSVPSTHTICNSCQETECPLPISVGTRQSCSTHMCTQSKSSYIWNRNKPFFQICKRSFCVRLITKDPCCLLCQIPTNLNVGGEGLQRRALGIVSEDPGLVQHPHQVTYNFHSLNSRTSNDFWPLQALTHTRCT